MAWKWNPKRKRYEKAADKAAGNTAGVTAGETNGTERGPMAASAPAEPAQPAAPVMPQNDMSGVTEDAVKRTVGSGDGVEIPQVPSEVKPIPELYAKPQPDATKPDNDPAAADMKEAEMLPEYTNDKMLNYPKDGQVQQPAMQQNGVSPRTTNELKTDIQDVRPNAVVEEPVSERPDFAQPEGNASGVVDEQDYGEANEPIKGEVGAGIAPASDNQLRGNIETPDEVAARAAREKADAEKRAADAARIDGLKDKHPELYKALMEDPEAMAIFKPLLDGQWQNVVDAKKKVTTPEQKKKLDRYRLMNEATAALSQMGAAVGNMVSASRGPVGGAMKLDDWYAPVAERNKEAEKKYDDSLAEVRKAQERYNDTLSKANAYMYRNRKDREAAADAAKRAEEKLQLEKQKLDNDYAKWVADNARKDKDLDAKLRVYESQINKNNAAAAKDRQAKKTGAAERYTSIRLGNRDINLPKSKWAESPENIAKAYSLLSDGAKQSVYEHVMNMRNAGKLQKSGASAVLNTDKDEKVPTRETIIQLMNDDLTSREFMRASIGQWLDKEGENDARSFVLSLLDDKPVATEGKDFTSDEDDEKDFTK